MALLPMNHPVKFGIAGYGLIGKRHATIVRNHPGAELTAVIDVDAGKRQAAKKDFNVPVFESLHELNQADSKPDVICVCTPNDLHAPLAIQALENNYHVVIEKPMALTKAQCEQIIYKSLHVSRNVFVVKQNRYSPPSKWLKSIVEKGILGKVFLVQINCYWNRDERYYKKGDWKGLLLKDGGTLFTQFSHFIDIMYWVFGDIRNIQARFANFNHRTTTEFEDSGIVSFEFVNGGIGSINFSTSCWDKNMESSITVIGAN
ncbi:MAG TPA: Gfo/Idh/MocA family oxidoreductase, partial [Chitinophagales bacterium]|nr:Gfo/Idh/MocA family oxidoreductase [Chitinophagales bacterium]